MESHLTLLTTASALALGLVITAANAGPTEAPGAKSDITIVGKSVPGTSTAEDSTAGQGADDSNAVVKPENGAGNMTSDDPSSADQGGADIKGGTQGQGATNKAGKYDKLPPSNSME
jgi:hypothetical protein